MTDDRMTDDRWHGNQHSMSRAELHEEGTRARSEEARLLKEVADKDAEIATLRQQVATLIAGQQRNGEARQQAFIEFAEDLAAMTPEGRDSTIRRMIDQRDNP